MSKVPEGWEVQKLSEVAYIQTGIAKGKKGIADPINLPYLRVANVQDGYLDLTEIKKITVSRQQIERYLLQKEDVLLTEGGDFDKLGRGYIWHGQIEPCLHQNHVFAVRTNKSALLPEFLSIQVSSSYGKKYFLGCAKQTTNLATINSTQLKDFPVLIPPLPEQKKIAAILSSVNEAIASTQAVIDQTRKVKQGLLQQLLTRGIGHTRFKESAIGEIPEQWKCVQIGNCSQIIDPNPSHRYPPPQETGIPLVSTANFIGEDDYDFSNCQYVSQETFEEQNRRCDFRYDDIIFARKGRIGLARQYGDLAKCFSHTLVSIKVNAALANSEYLLWVVRSPLFLGQIDQTMNSNSGVPTLGVKTISETLIPLPSLEEQEHIAYLLSSLHESITRNQDKITQLTVLKRGLMQELLTGRIRVKYPLPNSITP